MILTEPAFIEFSELQKQFIWKSDLKLKTNFESFEISIKTLILGI